MTQVEQDRLVQLEVVCGTATKAAALVTRIEGRSARNKDAGAKKVLHDDSPQGKMDWEGGDPHVGWV